MADGTAFREDGGTAGGDMRRVFSLDWRIASFLALILVLAFTAVLHSRVMYGSASGWREASEREQDCGAAKKANGGRTTKECKDLITLTIEDPVALYTLVLTAATVLLFVATSGLWYMAGAQSRDTKQAISASREANTIARQSLELGQRPWLGFEHFGPSEIRLQHNILSFKFPITVHNHGNGPALSVHFGCVMIRPQSGLDVWGTLRGLADFAMREVMKGSSNPVTIFPSQSHTLERNAIIEFTGEDIEAGQINLFTDYFLLLTYRHPTTGKAYCTATGYGSMREACPTYSNEGQMFDASTWPIHVMPGCNLVV